MNDALENFWSTTYQRNIAKLIGVCCRYTRNRQMAEDLAHDAFLVAINQLASFEQKGPFDAWLRRIVVNVALQYLREQKRRQRHEESITYHLPTAEMPDEAPCQEATAFSEAELMEAIYRLPEHHRLVFNLYIFDQFTHAQIGAELGISEGTSKSYLARARRKVREFLGDRAQETKKRNGAWLLFLLPANRWTIDQYFTRRLAHFEVPPRQSIPDDSFEFRNVFLPSSAPPAGVFSISIKTTCIIVAIGLGMPVVLLRMHAPRQTSDPVTVASRVGTSSPAPSKSTAVDLLSKKESTAATFSRKGIIVTKTTDNIENMKSLSILSTLVLASPTLAFDTANPQKNHALPAVVYRQEFGRTREIETAELLNRTTGVKRDSADLYGSIMASRLFWSDENHALYLIGPNIRVHLNNQKFVSSGRVSFVDRFNYLFFNGRQVQLNEIVELSEKTYYLTKPTEKAAVQKYGEIGKQGVVEVSLVE